MDIEADPTRLHSSRQEDTVTEPGPSSRFWHPFSHAPSAARDRIVFVAGSGAELTDSNGRRYIDGTAALWYCAIGHGRAEMADAISRQAGQLEACSCFDLFASDKTLELADRVARMVPVDDPAVFLTSGGSDAVDTAAKIARRYWAEVGRPDKQIIISREHSYHGMHAFGTSLAGIPANLERFGEFLPTCIVPAMDSDALEREIERQGSENVAAFFAEPMIGAGGVRPAPAQYLRRVADICRANDVLFVADEVVTGFGRTGRWFACERYGVRPDILLVAKAITSGYVPLGAAIFSGRVAEPFWAPRSEAWLRHGYTYSGHATACAAALANLAIMEAEDLVGRTARREERFAAEACGLEALPGVEEVRTIGLVAGVQLSSELVALNPASSRDVDAALRELGVISRPLAGNTMLICPPLVATDDQVGLVIEAMGTAIERVWAASTHGMGLASRS